MSLDDDEFSDLTPIPCSQDPSNPFVLEFTDDHGRFMSRFRAIADREEISARALDVCTRLNEQVPSDHAVWWYRRRIITEIGYELSAELAFVERVAHISPKAYQLWTHRVWIMERCEDPPDETSFFKNVIALDERNFHAWNYFMWFANRFDRNMWFYERTTEQIAKDPKNNSAWSARFSSIRHGSFDIASEADFALDVLKKRPECESACNFIRGLLGMDKGLCDRVKVELTCMAEKQSRTKSLIALLAHVAMLEGNTKEYDALCDKLAKIDVLRTRFWPLMKSNTHRYD